MDWIQTLNFNSPLFPRNILSKDDHEFRVKGWQSNYQENRNYE